MVAVEVMAAQTTLPVLGLYKRFVQGVTVFLHASVALLAELPVVRHADPVVLRVAAHTLMRADVLAGVGEARLQEAKDRVPIVGAVVAGQAVRVADRLEAKICGLVAGAQQVIHIGLDLLARSSGRSLMTLFALHRLVPRIHGPLGVRGVEVGRKQDNGLKDREATTDEVSEALPFA